MVLKKIGGVDMKKKKLIIIVIILLLIMFFPIPMGTYDDGTRTYNALTYIIVKWHKADLNVPGGWYYSTSVFWFPDNFKNIHELKQLKVQSDKADGKNVQTIVPDDFSIVFNFGRSTYDSETGILVKEKWPSGFYGNTVEDYTTEYYLTDNEKQKIFNIITEMDFVSYPDSYDPLEGEASCPDYSFDLKVKYYGAEKTIYCHNIAYISDIDFYQEHLPDFWWGLSEKSRQLINLHNTLEDILISSEEWKALPEDDVFID